MVMFIIEGGMLMILLINMIQRYRQFENLVRGDVHLLQWVEQSLESNANDPGLGGSGGSDAAGFAADPETTSQSHSNRNKKFLNFYGLRQRLRGNGFGFTSIMNKCDPACVSRRHKSDLASQ
eukprot:Gregarina_sp_Poly_1__5974@NODE_3147_length_1338_cov_9_122738_g1999_i0_p1_GENE_NODE_3147_length_1338_cov_9_122738_g1999_i0NODE_3147_length_1338_cov_9_122738_g1999_i0_p1_ORF_typecomplete_len122_score14_95_NODE_3147_length_1338_cov_9_122738_g1999_i0313678